MCVPKGNTQQTEDKKMTRFERDLKDALEGNEIEVLTKRQQELDRLKDELRCTKNGFRRQCLTQEITRLKREYNEISDKF